MITIDKYGQSVKIYDGEVNMFFDREPMLRGCYIIKATGIVYILNYIFGHYEDFVINGVPITTIEEFTEQYAMVIPLECGGSGGGERFGIEDDTGVQNRLVDMGIFSIDLEGVKASYLAKFNNTGAGQALQVTAIGTGMYASSSNSLGLDVNSNNNTNLGALQSTIGNGNSNDGSVLKNIIVRRGVSGIPLSGIGSSINFDTRTVNSNVDANRIISKLIDPNDASVTSQFQIAGFNNAIEYTLSFPVLTADRTVPISFQGVFADTNGNIEPYKVYTALLSQSGTSAPTATVLQNTIGNIVWSRRDAGLYDGTLLTAFPSGKVIFFCTSSGNNQTMIGYIFNAPDVIELSFALAADGTNVDEFTDVSVEIRVYP